MYEKWKKNDCNNGGPDLKKMVEDWIISPAPTPNNEGRPQKLVDPEAAVKALGATAAMAAFGSALVSLLRFAPLLLAF